MTSSSITPTFTPMVAKDVINDLEKTDSKYKKLVIAGAVLTGTACITALAVMVRAVTFFTLPVIIPALTTLGVTVGIVLVV